MYAVISTGGKQYKVSEGQTIRVERIPGEVGASISFDRVLMLSDGENVEAGRPTLPGVTVSGRILEQGKAKKVIVFKYKRRKRYRRKNGHRQHYTALKIETIRGA
ncbi:MAG: 50S ribosomal protein L21 [Desulfobacterales bacterium]|nr:50S ribosomal protein L21 [Desulfobacterales bacterium]